VTRPKLEDVLTASMRAAKCDTFTARRLPALALRELIQPSDPYVVPDVLSKERSRPVVRQRAEDGLMPREWPLYAMITERGNRRHSKPIDEAASSREANRT